MKKLLLRGFGLLLCTILLPVSAKATAFPDVVPGSWYEEAVEEMSQEGILSGCDDGTFQPMREISAAEFVAITLRCKGQNFALKEDHWASAALYHARDEGWFDWDEIPFDGIDWSACDSPISRQLAVKVLMRGLLPGTGYDYNTESKRLGDFSSLSGRYYESVLPAYAAGVVTGDGDGNFRPLDGLTRAEACILFQRALKRLDGESEEKEINCYQPSAEAVQTLQGGVSENGWLQVVGTQLCNERGEPVVLRGMSTHGLQWYGEYARAQSIANTAAYGANVFRVAMYTGEGGYLNQPEVMTQAAFAAVDAAIQQDMYVILDWHILSDGNPLTYVTEAEAFFSEAAARYGSTPNVLYEICNEPNGNVSWTGDVKPYAERVTSIIRAQAPQSVILIGSPTWSQDIHLAAADPVEGTNLMYTLHFYAGTHGRDLRDRIDAVLNSGFPVFISEWGTSRADGSGGVFLEESKVWLDYLDERDISWCNWSLCDKNETSAALKQGTSPEKVWMENDLTESGKFVFSRLKK